MKDLEGWKLFAFMGILAIVYLILGHPLMDAIIGSVANHGFMFNPKLILNWKDFAYDKNIYLVFGILISVGIPLYCKMATDTSKHKENMPDDAYGSARWMTDEEFHSLTKEVSPFKLFE